MCSGWGAELGSGVQGMAKAAWEGRPGQEERAALKAERDAVPTAPWQAARPPARPLHSPLGSGYTVPAPGTHGHAAVTPSPDPLVTTARGRDFAPKGTTQSVPINLGEVEPHQHPAPLGPGGRPPAEVQLHTAHPSSRLSFTHSQSPPKAPSMSYWSSRDALSPTHQTWPCPAPWSRCPWPRAGLSRTTDCTQ